MKNGEEGNDEGFCEGQDGADSWIVFCHWTETVWRHNARSMTLGLLHDVLVALFGTPSIGKLCKAKVDIAFLSRFATALNTTVRARTNWKRSTAHAILSALRSLLQRTKVHVALVRAVRLAPVVHDRVQKIFGFKGARNYPPALCREWENALRTNTRNRSALSLRNIMSFFLGRVLKVLQLDPCNWPTAEQVTERCQQENFRDLVRVICCGRSGTHTHTTSPSQSQSQSQSPSRYSRKFQWLQTCLTHLLRTPYILPREWLRQDQLPQQDGNTDTDTDRHRISKEELERIHSVAVEQDKQDNSGLNELFFMFLLTTGMRVGGLVNLKCAHIAKLVEGKWQVQDEGRTLEKGQKVCTFKIQSRVRELLTSWLNKKRTLAAENDYVFPGRDAGHVSTESFRLRFKTMCKAAGFQERRLHLHGLRHSFSHILLELGNSAETVSKLINHSSVATTQKYYLKESSAEVSERANIPWLPQSHKRANPVPDFLSTNTTIPEKRVQKLNRAKEVSDKLDALLNVKKG